MKLLIDQNLSPKLVKQLYDLFPGSKHLTNISLDMSPDMDVWEYARQNDFAIISKDTDFINLNVLKGFPPKVIWIQRGNCSTNQIFHLIMKWKLLLV